MKVIDINGKEREIKDDFKIVEHNRTNDSVAIMQENIDGELVKTGEHQITEVIEKFVEVTVIGKSREWTEWYQLEIFEKNNPNIKL